MARCKTIMYNYIMNKYNRVIECGKRFTTHGFTKGKKREKLYSTWSNIKTRCYNKNIKQYKHYGGKGIKMCSEWRESYLTFRNWSYKSGYKDGLTIDRIDNNKDYLPDNCRWVKKSLQSRNRPSVVKLHNFNGELLTLGEIAKKIGIKSSTISQRYYVYKFRGDKLFAH